MDKSKLIEANKLLKQARESNDPKERASLEKQAKALLFVPKTYFDVIIETMAPTVIKYRVLAETAEQAADMIKHSRPVSVQHKLHGKRDLKLKVYDAGTTFLRFLRNLAR